MSSKCKKMSLCSIAIIIVLIMLVIIRNACFKPDYIKEIRNNHVYLCGFYGRYPQNHQQRFYIEFKKNKTFILMYDDTRRNEENYDEDGDGSKPRLDIYFGEYEIKNGNYILKTTDSAGVSFKNTMAVAKKKINYYGRGIFEIEKYVLSLEQEKGNIYWDIRIIVAIIMIKMTIIISFSTNLT